MAKRQANDELQRQENLRLLALAEKGHADAQNVLAARLAQGCGSEVDLTGSLYWYAQAVALGYTNAKWNAGTMLIAGEGVAKPRRDLGMLLVEQAAESGDPSACRFISQCYASGRFGKAVNSQLRDLWHARSCDHKQFIEYGQSVALDEYGIVLIKPKLG